MNDVMIDLETLDTGPNATILSIGAVEFDRRTGVLGATFYMVVEPENQAGGTISAGTVQWWMQQSEQARSDVFGRLVKRHDLVPVLECLTAYLGDKTRADAMLWQRGNMDSVWLEQAYHRVGLQPAFKFWQWNDERTLTNLYPDTGWNIDHGTAHNALADAQYQAQVLMSVFNHIKK